MMLRFGIPNIDCVPSTEKNDRDMVFAPCGRLRFRADR